FGAPNGLCPSITESKHITAVKKPWRRSNKHNALGQILRTNQRHFQLVPTWKPEGCYLYHTGQWKLRGSWIS
ncbi:hypothetical protein PAXINDRAFT_76254, partial [Paxillus involutus ATCC 200175]